MDQDRGGGLTRRELEIVALIGEGLDSRRIAEALGVAYFTVRKHRSNILGKLNLKTSAKLSAYAARKAASGICLGLVSMQRGKP